jgi:hypothetical protein
VDEILSVAEATNQCLKEGYLLGGPGWDKCIAGYTN